ncbi:MAG: T9SS type A sorting domain-containing protein [Bacteroidota bacterium]
MNQQTYYFLFVALFFSVMGLSAQRVVPLEYYEPLQQTDKLRPADPTKMDCDPDLFGVNVLTAGDSVVLTIEADTVGFPDSSRYFCLNCDSLSGGTIREMNEGLIYFSDVDVEQTLDTLEIAFCKPSGDSCTFSETAIVLVQRAVRAFAFPIQVLGPQERVEVVVPEADLPGGLSCRRFVDCGAGDPYEGTGQEALFLFDIATSNDFRYEAARLAGLDLVCLELCNDLGLCDEYTFPFRIQRENVDLPFFDDFSRDELRPDLSLWQNEDVLINRQYGIQPPSIGVATFDAVDTQGRPYPVGTSSSPTPRDFLTSAGINMAAGDGNATLTFYAQPRGLGNRPEVGDSLVLQFLHPNGNWITVWSQRGLSSGEGNCTDRPFIGYTVPVPALYNYNGFQFRFYNLSSQTGGLDHWHLDYVKLDKIFTTLNFNDIALIETPPEVIAPYTAMPYRQFVAAGESLIRQDIDVSVFNHSTLNDFLPATQSKYDIRELNSGQILLPNIFFNSLAAIPAAEPFIGVENLTDLSFYNAYIDGLRGLPNEGTEKYQVVTTYDLDSETSTFTENATPGIAEWVSANNETSTITRFDDYYAFDDGTAELALEALSGQTVVQAYEAFVPEVLTGVSIRLPRVNSSTANQTIRLVVYLDELAGTEPDYFMDVNPIYPEDFYRDSLQGFTSYAFPEEITLPVGRFYLGWQQLGTCSPCVAVGLDRNNIIEGTRFFNNGGNWFPFEGCSTGAVMIRPLVGDSPVLETSTEDFTGANPVSLTAIFPNPARQFVHIQRLDGGTMSDLRFALFSMTGQLLQQGVGKSQLDISALPAGIYLLRCTDERSGQQNQHKLRVE